MLLRRSFDFKINKEWKISSDYRKSVVLLNNF